MREGLFEKGYTKDTKAALICSTYLNADAHSSAKNRQQTNFDNLAACRLADGRNTAECISLAALMEV